MNWKSFALLGALLFFLGAAVVIGTDPVRSFREDAPLPARYTEQLQRWQTTGPRSYAMVVEARCECYGTPLEVEVSAGRVVAARRAVTRRKVPLDTPELSWRLLTVEDLFEELAQGYKRRFDTVEVQYDATYGYPALLKVDRSKDVEDDGAIAIVSEFRPLDRD